MRPNPEFLTDLVTFTEEIFNGKRNIYVKPFTIGKTDNIYRKLTEKARRK